MNGAEYTLNEIFAPLANLLGIESTFVVAIGLGALVCLLLLVLLIRSAVKNHRLKKDVQELRNQVAGLTAMARLQPISGKEGEGDYIRSVVYSSVGVKEEEADDWTPDEKEPLKYVPRHWNMGGGLHSAHDLDQTPRGGGLTGALYSHLERAEEKSEAKAAEREAKKVKQAREERERVSKTAGTSAIKPAKPESEGDRAAKCERDALQARVPQI